MTGLRRTGGAHRSAPGRATRARRPVWSAVLAASGMVALGIANARADDAMAELRLEQGKFTPLEVVVPANTKVQLKVTNADATAIEFESFELHRERVIQPGETVTVYLPALAPGSYPFFDDFHRDTTKGAIVAK